MKNVKNDVVVNVEVDEIAKLEAEIAAAEVKQVEANAKKELELIVKYGPGTKFNRDIVEGSCGFDIVAKKYFVLQTCPINGEVFKTFTSDLFQKGVSPTVAKEQRSKNRKNKAKPPNIEEAKARLEALKARQSETASA